MRMHNDYVLVRKITEEVTEGGIFIPETIKKRVSKAVVVASSPSASRDGEFFAVRAGSTVVYDSLGGDIEVELKNEEGELEKLSVIQNRQIIMEL